MDDTTNLTTVVWRAPHKAYHLKPLYSKPYDLASGRPRERTYYCNFCAQKVVYTTSKSGKRYLCDAVRKAYAWRNSRGRKTGGSDVYYLYYPNLWHSKTCKGEKGVMHPSVAEYIARLAVLMKQHEARAQDESDAWQAHADDRATDVARDEARGL